MQPHNRLRKTEITHNKIALLLLLLSGVWLLCFKAEKIYIKKRVSRTYDRVGSSKITNKSIRQSIQILMGIKTPEELEYWSYLKNEYGVSKQSEQSVCILLFHDPLEPKTGQDQYISSLKLPQVIPTILQQNYTNYVVFYFNNFDAGQKIYAHLQDMALDKKFRIIPNLEQNNYAKEFLASRDYCKSRDIVLYLRDTDRLVGKDTLSLLNSLYVNDEKLKLVYTASLIQSQNNRQGKFSTAETYEYPKQILVKNQALRNHPYLMGGLLSYRCELMKQIADKDLQNSQGKPFKQIGEMVVGVSLLMVARGEVKYIPEPMMVKRHTKEYLSLNEGLREELKDFRNSKE